MICAKIPLFWLVFMTNKYKIKSSNTKPVSLVQEYLWNQCVVNVVHLCFEHLITLCTMKYINGTKVLFYYCGDLELHFHTINVVLYTKYLKIYTA